MKTESKVTLKDGTTWYVGGDDGLGTLYLCKTSFQAYQVGRGMAQADRVVSQEVWLRGGGMKTRSCSSPSGRVRRSSSTPES